MAALIQKLSNIVYMARINARFLIFQGSEWYNDMYYGINTRTSLRGLQSLDDLTVVGDRADAHPYTPTPYGTIERILDRLPEDTSEYTFVDYGSGCGRVILLAAQRRFRKVIGVEFARELHFSAQLNIANFRKELESPVESLHCDATKFMIPTGPCVFFIFNPFAGPTMQRVANNIITSYLADPRHMIVVYYNPTVLQVFEAGGHFRYKETIMEGVLSGLSHPRRYTARILEATS